jgi:hypothetical protein
VGLRSVVDLYISVSCCFRHVGWFSHTAGSGALAQEADHGLTASLEDLGCVHCGMDGVRLLRAEVGDCSCLWIEVVVVTR